MSDMMDILGDLTEKDAVSEKPIFTKGEVVHFFVKDFKVLSDKGNAILINTKVMTGQHAGRDFTLYIDQPDNDIRRKRRAQFFFQSGIWSKAELDAKNAPMARLMGLTLQGTAGPSKAGTSGTFQDINDIKMISGAQGMPVVAGAPAPAPAAVAAGQTTF